MKSYLFLFLLLNLQLVSVFAQYPEPLPNKPGTWKYAYLDDENTKMYCRQYGMNSDETAILRKKMDNLVSLLHQNPVMANPVGVNVAADSRPYYPFGFKDHPENYGYVGEINFRLPQWFSSKGREYTQDIEPPRVTLFLNDISLLKYSAFNVAVEGDDTKKAELRANEICKPMKIKEIAPGVILYDGSIVITKPQRQIFLPCTVDEAYKRLFAFYELAAKKEPAYQFILDGIKKEFASLQPAQLSGPAYFGGMFSGITPVKNNDPLYLYNNDFFDRSLPKTAIQIIVFPIDADYFRKESDFAANSVGFLRINQFQHSLDFQSLLKVIE